MRGPTSGQPSGKRCSADLNRGADCRNPRERCRGRVKRRTAHTIRSHRAGILAAIRLGLNNGRLEGLNSRIRLISHSSFGFHSPDPLVALVYLCCTRITIDLPGREFTTK